MYKCEICQSTKMKKLFSVEDRVIKRKEKYYLVECLDCRQKCIFPMPSDAEIGNLYPDDVQYYGENNANLINVNLKKVNKLVSYILYKKFNYPKKENDSVFIKIIGSIFIKLCGEWLYRHPKFHVPVYKKNGILLEIGFGSGNALLNFKNLGWEVIGIETSKIRCEQMKIKNNIRTINTSGYKIPLENQTVDVIYMNQAFEHMPHPKLALQEYYRVLKSGGQIIMTVPNISCVQAQLSGSKWRGIEAPRHLYLYSKKTLNNILTLSGFKEVSIKPVSLSLIDLIKFRESPTSRNNSKYIYKWWNNKYLQLLAVTIAPSLGFGESLFTKVTKK
jgi:ubiquinone/menaquinone biosynthesis C-methylase UbiE